MFWKKPKIEVFVRHCNFSEVSGHKNRLDGFTRKKCHENLLSTLDSRVNLTFLLDTFHPSDKPHFVLDQKTYPVIEIKEGTETGSFLRLLDHEKFLELGRQGALLISSLPGWSTHVEQNLASPCFEWELFFQKKAPVLR